MTTPATDRPPSTPLGARLAAVLLLLLAFNGFEQCLEYALGWSDVPFLLGAQQFVIGVLALIGATGAWLGRRWSATFAALYGVLAGVMIVSLGPLLDLPPESKTGLWAGAVVVLCIGGVLASYLRWKLPGALLLLPLALVLSATPVVAQGFARDSLRATIERAVARSEWPPLDAVIGRLRAAAADPATARDPWLHYDLGYALHRRASALLFAEQPAKAKPLLEESERALARAQTLGAGPTALALRGAVTGQMIGASGVFTAMRLGPRSFKQLDEAVAAAPNDPRVALLNGITRLNAPKAFGGGPVKGEAELRRAVALFADDRAMGPAPTWGRADSHMWLATALEKLDRRAEAKAERDSSLAIRASTLRSLLPPSARPAPM